MDFLYDDIFDNEYEDPASDMYYDDAMEADTADGSNGRFKALKDKIIAWFNSKIEWVKEKIRSLRGDEKSVWANLLSKIKSFFSKAKSADNPDDLVECQKMTQIEIDKTKGQILKAGGYKNMDERRAAYKEKQKARRNAEALVKQQQHRVEGAKVGVNEEKAEELRAKYGEKNAANKRRAAKQAEVRAKLEEAAKGTKGDGVIVTPLSRGQKAAATRRKNAANRKMAQQRHDAQIHDFVRDRAAESYAGYDEEDIAIMEAIEEFYSYDPSVEAALEAMGTNLDIQCTTAQECLNYMDGLEGEISKYNLNLRTLKVAAENYQADGDQEKFNTIAGPALEQLQASYDALGLTSESEKFNEACIEQLNSFFLGAQDLIYAKADEFLDDSEEYDEDDYAGESFLSSLVY